MRNVHPKLNFMSAATLAVVVLLSASAGRATPLLTSAYEAQLEAWLGKGDLIFTNLYTEQADGFLSVSDFHAAVDGQGPTFTLVNIFGNGYYDGATDGTYGLFDLPSQIIGGYNPQSWNSSNSYNLTAANVGRTAFLYNLTSGTIRRQVLDTTAGKYQTYNAAYSGPYFGGGDDLGIDPLGGVVNPGPSYSGDELLIGGPNYYFRSYFYIGDFEVWTFKRAESVNPVPDTAGTAGLLGVALLALAVFRRRVA